MLNLKAPFTMENESTVASFGIRATSCRPATGFGLRNCICVPAEMVTCRCLSPTENDLSSDAWKTLNASNIVCYSW